MKRIFIIIAVTLLTITLSGTIYAKYKKGYEVTNKTEDSVTIKGKKGDEITVQIKSKKYKVGDKVKYDAKKNRLRKDGPIEGC